VGGYRFVFMTEVRAKILSYGYIYTYVHIYTCYRCMEMNMCIKIYSTNPTTSHHFNISYMFAHVRVNISFDIYVHTFILQTCTCVCASMILHAFETYSYRLMSIDL